MKRYMTDANFARETTDFGDYGVKRKLSHTGNTAAVCWSAGNSYVVAEDEKERYFRLPDGTKVALLSINGLGEIRWRVQMYDMHRPEMLKVAEYFGLVAECDDNHYGGRTREEFELMR